LKVLRSEHEGFGKDAEDDGGTMGHIIESHRTIAGRVRRLLGMTLVLALLAAVAVSGAAASGSGATTKNSAAHDQYSSTKPLPPAPASHQAKGTAPTVVKTPTKVSGALPFTGTNLSVAAALGVVLVGAGLLLRLRRSDD
jgi:LPXTG-motif cell wall-anchored protein